MNCQDIVRILDDGEIGTLSAAEQEEGEAHALSCRHCARRWLAHTRLADLSIPPMPREFAAQMQTLVAAGARGNVLRFVSRRMMVLAGGFAALAAASMLLLKIANAPVPQQVNAAAVQAPPPAAPVSVASVLPGGRTPEGRLAVLGNVPPKAGDQRPVTGLDTAAASVLDPHTVVLVMRPEPEAGAEDRALADRCSEIVAKELRALGGLKVIADSSVFPVTDYRLTARDQAIARGHGAGYVLRASTEMGCSFTLFRSQSGEIVRLSVGIAPRSGDVYPFARDIARNVHDQILAGKGEDVPPDARLTLLNAASSDRDRAEALARMVEVRGIANGIPVPARNVFDKDVLAAAMQLVTNSPDAVVRMRVLYMLYDAKDTAVVPLLQRVIAEDPDVVMRHFAILAVRKFLDVPGVRETLQRAAASDPDSKPAVFCCADTVREQAERAVVPDSELPAWVRSKLLDETLPARSRLFNLLGTSYDGRVVGGFSRIGQDVAPVVLEIGRSDPDPRVRAMAWDALYLGQADREFVSTKVVPVLLHDLRTSTEERVRAAAARILFGFRENPEVQGALQQAQSDASIRVRRAAEGAGRAPESGG